MKKPDATVEYRAVRDADLDELCRMAEGVWRTHYAAIISMEQINYMLARQYTPELLKRDMAAKSIRFTGAFADGKMVGFAGFGPEPGVPEWKLHKLYILPEFQRCGIGQRLMRDAADAAAAHGAEFLVLNVNKRNAHALAAYRKFGFRRRTSVKVDIGGGFVMDDDVLEYDLRKENTL